MQQASQPPYPQHRVFSEFEQKLRRLTIVVGMVGSDGILLAADQRLVQPAQNEKQFDQRDGICKIVNVKQHKLAYARVGDYVSRMVGEKIISALDTEDFGAFDYGHVRLLLIDIAEKTVKDEAVKPHFNGDIDRSLLIVFYGLPELQLWKLWVSPPYPAADRIATFSICGAIGNPARFFDHYFRPTVPIDRLTFLASHIVLTASRIDSQMIQGLDVALFDKEGFRLLDETQKEPLRQRSKRLEASIRRKLFADPRKSRRKP